MLNRNQIFLSVIFILIAGFFFLSTPETSYAQPVSDCCFSNGSPGCDTQFCEDAVCNIDPFCCNISWDGICAGEAVDLCGGLCQDVPVGCCTGLDEFPDSCDITSEAQCINEGGTYQGDGTNCGEFSQCFARPIPTMSEWGLIGTAGILGLIGFFYILTRRKRAIS